MTDYAYWESALAGTPGQIYADHPQPGFYKYRSPKKLWEPIAIWRKDETLVARIREGMVDPLTYWTRCADNPISRDVCKAAFETGQFPGDIQNTGHNSGQLSLLDELTDAIQSVRSWLTSIGGKIKDATQNDMAANWRQRIGDLKKKVDDQRDAEKRPHLEAGRQVDAKYKPAIEEADAATKDLREVLGIYMRAEEARLTAEREAQRKAEITRVEAERKRISDEQAKLMRDDPIQALTTPTLDLPTVDPTLFEPVKVQAGGQRGRRTGLRTVTNYVCVDYAATLAHVKYHPDVRAAVEKVGEKLAKAGAVVPGMEAKVEKVAV